MPFSLHLVQLKSYVIIPFMPEFFKVITDLNINI